MALNLIQGKQIEVNLTGSFSGSFTGNLVGSASFASTASFAQSGNGSFSGSFSGSGANLSGIPASGIVGLNLSQIATGSVTASVSPTQFTVTSGSSTELVVTGTGVTIGNTITDTHRVTGSLSISGSVTATNFTGSLFGTASWANNATSASFAVSSSRSVSSSFSTSASFAQTSSIVQSIANNITNNVDNYVLTATGGDTINGESNLTFDGSLLKIQGSLEQGSPNVDAIGISSHAEGLDTSAEGDYSHAEGSDTRARGEGSHAEGSQTYAEGNYSHAEGYTSEALGTYSHAEGNGTIASGSESHAEGRGTVALGRASHAEGVSTYTEGDYSHAEGNGTISSGSWSHAEGDTTQAIGDYSHAEGSGTQATGESSHAEGENTLTIGIASHAEGNGTETGIQSAFSTGKNPIVNGLLQLDGYGDVTGNFNPGGYLYLYDDEFDGLYGYASFLIDTVTWDGSNTLIQLVDTSVNTTETYVGDLTYLRDNGTFGGDSTIPGPNSHAEGLGTKSIGPKSHAEGQQTYALGYSSHAEGSSTQASGQYSHAEGYQTQAIGELSHAEGRNTQAIGQYSHTEGSSTVAIGDYSHAEGAGTNTIGNHSHAEGQSTTASGSYSHAEGYQTIALETYSHAEGYSTQAIGYASHAEGESAIASGSYSHAEGKATQATGQYSHTEGFQTTASGTYSHAEGASTQATGEVSHAEGVVTQAIGYGSHAEGFYTVASGSYQHVQGQYNISSSAQSAFIIGNGTTDNARSNLVFASGSTFQVTGSVIATQGFTGSLLGTAATASFAPAYLPLAGGTISGSLVIQNNLTVLGSASIQYISESTLNIGTNLITVNTINPGARFGGLAIIDSGSSPQVSASFLYDSVQDEFIFVHRGTSTSAITSSHFVLGPETYNNLGNENYLTANRIPKSVGNEHLNDSNISDNGSIVSIDSNTQVTGSLIATQGITGSLFGTSSFASTASFLASTTNAFLQGGNSFGAQALLGTNDNQNLALETSGSIRMFISSSGNVGINTTSPSARLDVNGNMIVGAGNKSIGSWPFYISDSSNLGWKVSDSSGTAKFELYVGNAGINQMRLLGGVSIVGFSQDLSLGTSAYLNTINISNTNGNVGIGTTTPTGRLSVVDTTAASGSANSGSLLDLNQTWNTTGTPTAIRLDVTDTASNTNSNLVDLRVGGVSRFSITKSGRISFGVVGGSTPSIFAENNGITFTNIVVNNQTGYNFSNGQGQIFSTFGTNNGVRVNAAGFVGFVPTSGTAIYNSLLISEIINQTGGANGITRGLFIQPTLTSAADWRAIETTNGRWILTDTYSAGSGSLANPSLDINTTWNTTGTPTAIRANITDTASNANSLLMDLQVGGTSQFRVVKSGIINTRLGNYVGQSISSTAGFVTMDPISTLTTPTSNFNVGVRFTDFRSTTSPGFSYLFSSVQYTDLSYTSSLGGYVSIQRGFAPTSGTGVFNVLTLQNTINQTGGANGITRGLFVDPTLTSAFDFRAIENTVGNVTLNTTSGNTSIGKTNPNARLDVNGNTIVTGSLAVSQSLLQYSNITAVTSGSTSNVASFSTGSYTAAFFDYVATSGTNARAGSVFTVWNGNNVEYAETSTNDIGNTNNLLLSASLSAGAIRLQATSLSGSWSVRTLARMI